METYEGVEVIQPRILNLGTRWRWVVRFMLRAFYSGVSYDTRLGGPHSRSGRGAKEQRTRSCQESESSWEADSPSASQEIPHLSRKPKFITVFTRARHWSPSITRWI